MTSETKVQRICDNKNIERKLSRTILLRHEVCVQYTNIQYRSTTKVGPRVASSYLIHLIVLLLIIICRGLPQARARGQCVPGVQCSCTETRGVLIVDCRNRYLSRIPNGIPRNTLVLDLRFNKLTRVNWNSLSSLTNLRKIMLTGNMLTCDPELTSLQQWAMRKRVSLTGVSCSRRRTQYTVSDRYQGGAHKCHVCEGNPSMGECDLHLGNLTECQNGQDACETTLIVQNGVKTVRKGCRRNEGCGRSQVAGMWSCQLSVRLSTCRFCCTKPGCNRQVDTQNVVFPAAFIVKMSKSGQAWTDYSWRQTLFSQLSAVLRSVDGEHKVKDIPVLNSVATVHLTSSLPLQTKMVDIRDQLYVILRQAATDGRISYVIPDTLSVEAEGVCGFHKEFYQGDQYLWPTTVSGYAAQLPCASNSSFALTRKCIAKPGDTAKWESVKYQNCPLQECPADDTADKKGMFHWKATPNGNITLLPCPVKVDNNTRLAQRACMRLNGDVKWQLPDTSECPYVSNRTRDLQNLSSTPVTAENVKPISEELVRITKDAEDFQAEDVTYASQSLENVILSNQTLDGDTSQRVVDTLGNMINARVNVLTESQHSNQTASRMIRNTELLAQRLMLRDSETEKVVVHKNLAVAVKQPDLSSNRDVSFQLKRNKDYSGIRKDMIEMRQDGSVQMTPESMDALVTVPGSVPGRYPSNLYFIAYNKYNFFQAALGMTNASSDSVSTTDKNALYQEYIRTINGKVVAVGVTGTEVKNLKTPVKLYFRHHYQKADSAECSYWSFDKDGGTGGWSTEGVTTEASELDYTVCTTSHLTNFALLMDVYDTGKYIDNKNQKAMSLISYIGCGISMTGLLLTLLSYLWFKKLRKANTGKILINLCTALACVLLLFVISTQYFVRENVIACKATAMLLHYMLLAAWCWMLIESYCLYLALVKVFRVQYSHFILKCSVFAWGLPLIIVIITISVSRESYSSANKICWLGRTAFYGAFLAPVSLVLVLNAVAFVIVIRQLRSAASTKIEKSQRTNLAAQIRGAVGITVLLGLTWVFAFFAIGGASIVFHYLFVLSNSLQGVLIFTFYCLLKPDVQRAWRRCLPCCPSTAEDSRTSTATRGKSGNFNTTLDHSKSAGKRRSNKNGKRRAANDFIRPNTRTTMIARDSHNESSPRDTAKDKTTAQNKQAT